MSHEWRTALVHHPLGMLWPALILALITSVVIAGLRRRRSPPAWLIRMNVVFWLAGLLGAIMSLIGEVACAGLVAEETQCRSAMKELSKGILLYAEDWDERLPLPTNWFDAVRDRAGEAALRQPCPAYRGTYPYAMNRHVCGILLSEATTPDKTVMVVEHPCRAFNETTTRLVPDAFRHRGCAHVSFLDGRVQPRCRHQASDIIWYPQREASSATFPATHQKNNYRRSADQLARRRDK